MLARSTGVPTSWFGTALGRFGCNKCFPAMHCLYWSALECWTTMGVTTLVLCLFANSWPHTSWMCVACKCSPSMHCTSDTLGPGNTMEQALLTHQCYTTRHSPTSHSCCPVRPLASCPSIFVASSPTDQLPRAICVGRFSSPNKPTNLLLIPLADHLQCFGSSHRPSRRGTHFHYPFK